MLLPAHTPHCSRCSAPSVTPRCALLPAYAVSGRIPIQGGARVLCASLLKLAASATPDVAS
eukprot:3229552-Rhodomonas_salina.9